MGLGASWREQASRLRGTQELRSLSMRQRWRLARLVLRGKAIEDVEEARLTKAYVTTLIAWGFGRAWLWLEGGALVLFALRLATWVDRVARLGWAHAWIGVVLGCVLVAAAFFALIIQARARRTAKANGWRELLR